ncbi:MAG: hypothetical protein ACXVQ7_03085 [Actinomycetota bacterium]
MSAQKAIIPKRLADAISHSARPGKGEEATKAAERLIVARDEGRTADARKAAIRAKQAAPRSAWVREQLGLLAYTLEEFHEAVQELLAYRRFTGDHRHDPAIAESYRRLGKPARALELLAELKRADVPAKIWVEGQIARARALADTGRTETARTLLKAAVREARPADRAPLLEAWNDLR